VAVRRGYEFDYKLLTEEVQWHSGVCPPQNSFVRVDGNHVVLTAPKKAVDNDALLVRFCEWAGKADEVEITVPNGATGAQPTDLMEQPEGPSLNIVGRKITVPMHPYESVSVRISYKSPSQKATSALGP
jgi:alpha-mannosidase